MIVITIHPVVSPSSSLNRSHSTFILRHFFPRRDVSFGVSRFHGERQAGVRHAGAAHVMAVGSLEDGGMKLWEVVHLYQSHQGKPWENHRKMVV